MKFKRFSKRSWSVAATVLLACSLLTGGLSLPSQTAYAATTYTLNPAKDTTVTAASPTSSSGGTSTTLSLSGGKAAFLQFNLNSLSGTVTEAKLKLYTSSAPGGGYGTLLYSGVSNDSWTESMTWNSKPDFGAQEAIGLVSAAGYVTVDVTNYIKTQAAGDKLASLMVVNGGSGSTLTFNSRESGSNKPVLEVTTGGSANTAPYINKVLAGNKQVIIGWAKVPGISSYKLYRSTDPTTGFTLVKDGIKTLQFWDSPENGLANPIANGTTYFYKVGAISASGAETLSAASPAAAPSLPSNSRWNFPADTSGADGYIGVGFPGGWRPFSDDSPWNTPIGANPVIDRNSGTIIAAMAAVKPNIKMTNAGYTIPIHAVNSDKAKKVTVKTSTNIFDAFDTNRDDLADFQMPLPDAAFGEGTSDGHITIIDPYKKVAWECSRFNRAVMESGGNFCSTFNVWDLTGKGTGTAFEGERYDFRGGRAAGFPNVAGLLRPEELEGANMPMHALVFGFPYPRKGAEPAWDILRMPATRTDGKVTGEQWPMQGMRLQLDPSITEAQMRNTWGITSDAAIKVAKTLQTYGMYFGDTSGSLTIFSQMINPADTMPDGTGSPYWEAKFPGLYEDVKKIPTTSFRILQEGADAKEPGFPVSSAAPVKINFQPSTAAVPGGYLVDAGDPYGSRGNGQTYGWIEANDQGAYMRDRNINSDQRLDTIALMRIGNVWEIALPNGAYSVKISVGDAGGATNHTLNVEGVSYWNNTATAANQFLNATKTVTVSDGKLTLDNGTASDQKTRLNYIEITPL